MDNESNSMLNKKDCILNNPQKKIKYDKINRIFNQIDRFLIFILIIIIIFLLKNKNQNVVLNDRDFVGNYSLYNIIKLPQITVLVPLYKDFDNNTINFINSISNQTLRNIEIDLFFSKKKQKRRNHFFNDTRIKITTFNNKTFISNIYHLINKSKGKFIFIINKHDNLEYDDFERLYNFTFGKINNIFNFTTKNGNIIYLIRAKVIKDLIDKGIFFDSYDSLINYIIKMNEPNLNYVSVSFCPDDHYASYAYVAMISILRTKYYNTYVSFYLVIPQSFTQKSKDFLSSLYNQYELFNITFLSMDNRYDNAFISRYLTSQAYYRFSLGELIPYLDKIIYLDTDVIAYYDLTQFYSLNFNGKMILAQQTYSKKLKEGLYKINSGVLLLNLHKMREYEFEKKILFLLNNGYNDDFHDQNLINYYFYEYVELFPPKFHARPWNNYSEIEIFNKNSGYIYDSDYLYFSNKYPTVRHYLYKTKPIYNNFSHCEDWWYFARTSKYYKGITDNLSDIFNFTYD